jgi:hypothetical protein
MRDKKEAIKFQTKETGTLLSTQLQVKRSKHADLCCVLCSNGEWNESWRRRYWVWFKHLGEVCDVNSDLVYLNGIAYDENLQDISLNINELLKKYNMTTCP